MKKNEIFTKDYPKEIAQSIFNFAMDTNRQPKSNPPPRRRGETAAPILNFNNGGIRPSHYQQFNFINYGKLSYRDHLAF